MLDVAKGTVGPLLAGVQGPLATIAGALAVTVRSWSPFLRGRAAAGSHRR